MPFLADFQGADPERVELAMERYETVFFEAEPGDALFCKLTTANLCHDLCTLSEAC